MEKIFVDKKGVIEMKLNAVKFGIAAGIVWGFGVLFIALASHYGLWTEVYEMLTRFYYGFNNLSLIGYFLGLAWSFIDAFIGAFLVAYLYNKLL